MEFCRISLIFCLFLAAACAKPVEQTYLPPVREPALTAVAVTTGNGAKLPLKSWLPKGNPQAVILALHGFNDYSHAFALPGEYFARHGIAVYAYDQRGFGSAAARGIWAGEKNLVADARDTVTALRQRYPRVPLYMLGESMGGAVAIMALSDPHFPPVNGVILSAPAVWGGEAMNPFYRATLWALAHTFPNHLLTGKGLKILASDNIPMLRALGRDPLVIKATRADAVYGLVQLMGHAYRNVARVRVPKLLLYGARDQVIPKTPIEKSIPSMQRPYRVAYYPDGYHMLLRDLRAEIVWRDVVGWIKNRDAALPSGYDRLAPKLQIPIDKNSGWHTPRRRSVPARAG